MFSNEALSEIHERAHRSFKALLSHCATLTQEEMDREFPEFGYPSIRLQIHHVIGAERYWIEVLKENIKIDDDAPDYPTAAALEEFRATTFDDTQKYLRDISREDLNTATSFKTWGGNEYELVPANVVIRPVVHIFHHAGQVSIMCKTLGRPAAPFDYPIG